jgi:hypothetical protein
VIVQGLAVKSLAETSYEYYRNRNHNRNHNHNKDDICTSAATVRRVGGHDFSPIEQQQQQCEGTRKLHHLHQYDEKHE